MISIVVAMGKNHVIGVGGKLPWLRIPADMRRFRELTLGKPVVMGRKTFESLGRKPLRGRLNVVLSRDRRYKAPNCLLLHSVEDVMEIFAGFDEVMVIGGAEIYRAFLPYASRIYLTKIDLAFGGDTYFPYVNWPSEWRVVESERVKKGRTSPYNLLFEVFERYPKP
uniref:Dihydrofolate reductase n=1 Tax=candidate division WWE3 bacterium TaxID=2053526 RepID=A0A831Z0Z3_UNCKA